MPSSRLSIRTLESLHLKPYRKIRSRLLDCRVGPSAVVGQTNFYRKHRAEMLSFFFFNFCATILLWEKIEILTPCVFFLCPIPKRYVLCPNAQRYVFRPNAQVFLLRPTLTRLSSI